MNHLFAARILVCIAHRILVPVICLGRRFSISKLALLTIPLLCTACGTYNLGNVHPQASKTADQQQLDTLTCKDQAHLAANSGERQVGAFLLGLTIVGVPFAFEMEKAKSREVFTGCMRERGYTVTAADDDRPTNQESVAPNPSPDAAKLKMDLPGGWERKPLTKAMVNIGGSTYAVNRTTDTGLLVIAVRREGITDLMAYAMSQRANQENRLTDTKSSPITRIEINDRSALRFDVTGSFKETKLTYLVTIIEGVEQLAIIKIWTTAANFALQKEMMESLAATISGIS